MPILDSIKNLRRNSLIRDLKETPRDKSIKNIGDVRSIGVICQLDDENNWNILYHFARVMEGQGKEVHFLALMPKDHEIGFVVTHQSTCLCRPKTDFNFWGLPRHESISEFTSKQFDLLIDTIGGDSFFSQYVALNTNAALRVAYATPDEDPTETYDLIIRGEEPLELKSYFNNIIEYLSMIKK